MPHRLTAPPQRLTVPVCAAIVALSLLLALPQGAAGATRSFAPVKAGSHVLVFRVDGVRPALIQTARVRVGRSVRTLRVGRVRRSLRDRVLHVSVRPRRVRRLARTARLTIRSRAAQRPRALRPAPLSGVASYVSPGGSDSGAGSAGAPWRTLAHAADQAEAGSTVVLEPGSYGGSGEITRLSGQGQPGSPITFTGRPGAERPRILGQLRIEGAHIHVRGVVLDGPTGPVARTSGDNPGGEDVKLWIRGDNAVLADSEVRGARWHAGVFVSEANDVRIEGNFIHHNGQFGDPAQSNLDHGIYWSSGSGAIVDNRIERNYAYGVHLYPEASHVLVSQNEISGHGRGGVIVGERAAYNKIVANDISGNREGIKTYALSGAGNVARGNRVWGNWEANFGATSGLELRANRGQG